MSLVPPVITRVADEGVDRVLRAIRAAVAELQGVPIVGGKSITVTIGNNANKWIPHNLRRPAKLHISPPRGGASSTGRVTDITEEAGVSEDRTKVVVLRASGWGVPITVDVWIY